jgi:hypothetical protein
MAVQVYRRSDGLWDVEARLTDKKAKDFKLVSGLRPASEPVHDMSVCITINEQFDVLDAHATSFSVPYVGYCEKITPSYKQLIGLNLLKNFNREVRMKFGKTAGCTHITELTAVMPTAAVQAFAGEVKKPSSAGGPNLSGQHVVDSPPFYIDSCHSLKRSGDAVKTFYPQWFRPEQLTE